MENILTKRELIAAMLLQGSFSREDGSPVESREIKRAFDVATKFFSVSEELDRPVHSFWIAKTNLSESGDDYVITCVRNDEPDWGTAQIYFKASSLRKLSAKDLVVGGQYEIKGVRYREGIFATSIALAKSEIKPPIKKGEPMKKATVKKPSKPTVKKPKC